MAALVVTFLPTSISHDGEHLVVHGEVKFDSGDYAAGGNQAAWDFSTAPNAAFQKSLKVSNVHASRPPVVAQLLSGAASHALNAKIVAGSALPKVQVTQASNGAEVANGPLAAAVASPATPHRFTLKYRANI
jgi:hypothetical protein